ncbi:hypothetical protein WJX72_003190 [[Myrmecia] bisecta]|uniref:DUF1517 domain-containing protein n=1 Tax=[Myrmecia] bisecta TaxID=41462 RepID=A0AAW1QEJ8_9CHLO
MSSSCLSCSTPEQSRVQKFLTSLAKGAAVAALAAALVLSSVSPAWAARSGGRVGGSSFSSARSYGGSSSRSYGGSSGLSSSRSYSSAPSVTLGGGVGLHSWFAPTPWGYGYGGGYGGPVSGGGGFFNLLIWGVVALVVVQVAQSFLSNGDGVSVGGERVAVAKVQVGLLGSARGLQRDLDRIAGRADTNTPEGLHYVLQETVLALNRNPDYCVYGAAKVSNQRDLDAGEDKFNQVSIEERSKFKEETLSNVGGRSRRAQLRSSSRGDNDLIVVTILVAVQGGLKLPSITSREELRTALNRLGAVRSEQVMAVEVLWTPQEEGDYFTRDELAYDYPTLNTL